ncbi:MAG: hypothetical protein IPJ77_07255 [Planctomycetes bacterium]|nr:hypothetical protein [Planctomycetota bacterium]
MFAMSAIDLAWVVSTWVDPWSWIAVPVVLVSPLWAAANVCALRAVEGRATSSGGAPA